MQSGAIINQSELAHFGQISTTRMTQIMWMDKPTIAVEVAEVGVGEIESFVERMVLLSSWLGSETFGFKLLDEYVAKCQCCKSFHSHPEDVEQKAKYNHKVRQAVLDRILVDKLNTARVQQAMKPTDIVLWRVGQASSQCQ